MISPRHQVRAERAVSSARWRLEAQRYASMVFPATLSNLRTLGSSCVVSTVAEMRALWHS